MIFIGMDAHNAVWNSLALLPQARREIIQAEKGKLGTDARAQ